MGTTYDNETIALIKFFEQTTKTPVKDCFMFKERLTFVVEPGTVARALGKQAANVHKLESMMNKKIRIVEFNENREQFILNMLRPLAAKVEKTEEELVVLSGPDEKTRGLMIGARAQNLRALEVIIQKYFTLKEIKVVAPGADVDAVAKTERKTNTKVESRTDTEEAEADTETEETE
jgi:N utilization substance protein A